MSTRLEVENAELRAYITELANALHDAVAAAKEFDRRHQEEIKRRVVAECLLAAAVSKQVRA